MGKEKIKPTLTPLDFKQVSFIYQLVDSSPFKGTVNKERITSEYYRTRNFIVDQAPKPISKIINWESFTNEE